MSRFRMNSEVQLYDEEIVNRFWSHVLTSEPNKCWEWIANCDSYGYGRIWFKGKLVKAHRFSFENHHNRKIKEGMVILHSCDNPACVNPNHLSEGTQKENVDDMIKKNRKAIVKGEKNGSSKLTQEQVNLIRIKHDLYANVTQRSLAKEFKVSTAIICLIVNFKAWI